MKSIQETKTRPNYEPLTNLTNTDLLIIAWMILSGTLAITNSLIIQATAMGYIASTILFTTQIAIVYKYRTQEPILFKLTIIGITAGFVEVIADYFLITIGSLHYPATGLFILKSPLYMPFAWNFIIVQLGYISYRLYNKIGKKSTIITGITAATYVGLLEILASGGKLWWYEKAALINIHKTPLYIMLGEGIMFSTILLLIKKEDLTKKTKIKKNQITNIITKNTLKGITFGFIILASYVFAYYFLTIF